MTDGSDSGESPGWDAITAALQTLYPGQEPKHYATVVPYFMGGPDPIDGVSVFRVEAPVPHWHYVTQGFSELHEKESDDPEVSGFGFELTFRLERGEEAEPPVFAINLLQNLARYVFGSGNAFAAGHHLDLNGPIMAGAATDITGVCFVADPKLPMLSTPNGRLEFLQVVGITADELAAVKAWNSDSLIEILQRSLPLLTTGLGRTSILADPERRAEIEARTKAEGSSMGMLHIAQVRTTKAGLFGGTIGWTIGAHEVPSVVPAMLGRICHGTPLLVTDGKGIVELVQGPAPAAEFVGDDLTITLTPALGEGIASDLEPRRGTYTWPELPGFVLTVEPSDIRDSDGNVVETIG